MSIIYNGTQLNGQRSSLVYNGSSPMWTIKYPGPTGKMQGDNTPAQLFQNNPSNYLVYPNYNSDTSFNVSDGGENGDTYRIINFDFPSSITSGKIIAIGLKTDRGGYESLGAHTVMLFGSPGSYLQIYQGQSSGGFYLEFYSTGYVGNYWRLQMVHGPYAWSTYSQCGLGWIAYY